MTDKGRILLVEDDRHIREILAIFIQSRGYVVQQAVSVRTALMHLDALDLVGIVLDLRLPNGHGKRVVEELKAKRNDVPVVILSAFTDEIELEFPVVYILKKPFERDELVKAITIAEHHSNLISSMRDSTRRLRDLTDARVGK